MNIIISNSSNEPIYQQIIDQIKKFIVNGDLNEGESLPSIRNLAKELQISVITTKRAYEELEKQGYLETVAGKGSFVAAQNKELLRENRIRILEERLAEAVETAKNLEIDLDTLYEMLKIFYKEV